MIPTIVPYKGGLMKFHWFIWFPRIMLLIYAIFIVIFSSDVFGGQQIFITKLLDFLLHSIPTIVLLLILWLAWRKPMWGGLLIILVSLIFTVLFKTYHILIQFLMISICPFIIGLLFIIVHYMKPRKPQVQDASTKPLP
jgi:hypothetical protein